ncbi:MAG: hypothetical protein KH128_12790 [Firmicutes bacterium]|nr:hypothetical protein [Bacillota bacterium]
MIETWQAVQALYDIQASGYGEKRCKESALRIAEEALKMQIPEKVEIKARSPAYCPTCGNELSTHHGDGYYTHPTFLERCPRCGRKLKW